LALVAQQVQAGITQNLPQLRLWAAAHTDLAVQEAVEILTGRLQQVQLDKVLQVAQEVVIKEAVVVAQEA
jgi:hypothetical protein